MITRHTLLFIIFCGILLPGCSKSPWNNPYSDKDREANIYYSSFAEQPKTLDPALSYNVNEVLFTAQIYEPPLQYHYLKRPLTVVPLTATEVPKAVKQGSIYVYTIHIKPGILYQPHPAFANVKFSNLRGINTLEDFPQTGTRELIAEDYVYEIKRLASPKAPSPILGLMRKYILGLDEYARDLQTAYAKTHPDFFDLRQYPLVGAKVIDRYTYQITLKENYPQFIYWLTMPFFAPVPWEADAFYSQPGMQEKNISLAWYPVGTGPYMLVKNNPNRIMMLSKNPNFHEEFFPSEAMPGDKESGVMENAGKRLPFVDHFVFMLEKESIPRWNKFFQGYYDQSIVGSDSFDEAIQIDARGEPHLTPEMKARGIYLKTTPEPTVFYLGFNMLDPVVGGVENRARKLRQALSIAIDYDEYITIFLNGRGTPAQGPLTPGIFGAKEGCAGINPVVYRCVNGTVERRTIAEAKQLLAEAGYPDGVDPKTGHKLILNYDVAIGARQEEATVFAWMRKEFEKLGIQLQVRDTQYNRFQEKVRTGNVQLYTWGWHADYPDPENFLFLFYGPNGKVKFGGENASNYTNPEFDKLFEAMKNQENGPARQALIDRMIEIVRTDAPWIFGFYPSDLVLSQRWVAPTKLGLIISNTLKYVRIDPRVRAQERDLWNPPRVWPLAIILAILVAVLLPVFMMYRHKERVPFRQSERKKQ